ncbi:MAG: hypothetical protein AMXMBFR84_37490 [Candidatus Hydrogenedentota bacterium]
MEQLVELGKSYTDNITGITGVATAAWIAIDAPPQAKLEYVDRNGHHADVWIANTRLKLAN